MPSFSWRPAILAVPLAALAGCTPPPPPPPPPPPVVVAEPIPYRPIPPAGAAYYMTIPPVGPDGIRRTINYGLTEAETIWHFRSAWNVAALNCQGEANAAIVPAYGEFLKRFPRELTAANRAIDAKYRALTDTQRNGLILREEHSTQVYNYFTTPAARADFCTVARLVSDQFTASPPTDLAMFATAHLPLFENAFENFFKKYEEYQVASAEWDAAYGAQYGASQPGYVAVHGSQRAGFGETLLIDQPAPVETVLDPDTGVPIPVIPVPESSVRTPVVQPVLQEQPEPAPSGN